MAGQKTTVKSHKPVTDKKTGKTTLKPIPRKGQSVSAKIAARKSKKTKVVRRTAENRGELRRTAR